MHTQNLVIIVLLLDLIRKALIKSAFNNTERDHKGMVRQKGIVLLSGMVVQVALQADVYLGVVLKFIDNPLYG